MPITLSDALELPPDQGVALYAANHWSLAKKPGQLLAALNHSHSVVTAWENEMLVGLGNAISHDH